MVIFGAGVITGGLLVHNTTPVPPAKAHKQASTSASVSRPGPLMTPGNARVDFLKRVQRELNLTSEQRQQIEEVLRKSQERTRKLMEPVTPKIREEIQQTREEFKAVLTPEQVAEFDRLWKQQQRPREKGSGERPPRQPRTGTNETTRPGSE